MLATQLEFMAYVDPSGSVSEGGVIGWDCEKKASLARMAKLHPKNRADMDGKLALAMLVFYDACFTDSQADDLLSQARVNRILPRGGGRAVLLIHNGRPDRLRAVEAWLEHGVVRRNYIPHPMQLDHRFLRSGPHRILFRDPSITRSSIEKMSRREFALVG